MQHRQQRQHTHHISLYTVAYVKLTRVTKATTYSMLPLLHLINLQGNTLQAFFTSLLPSLPVMPYELSISQLKIDSLMA